MKPAVISARYSSHSQNEQSIEGQLKVCHDFAKRNGYTIVGEYIDRAMSGREAEKRTEFQRMIADSAKRQFEAVIVYQFDRFARNRYDSAIYKARLKKNGVKVLSACEIIADDASGILMEAVLEGMAEYYSVELSQKVKRGLEINAEKCLCTGGIKVLGFKTDSEKRFIIDEDGASIVKRVFDMYISGSKMFEIMNFLNQNGVKTSMGNDFNKNSIRRILTNKQYTGVYIRKEIETPDGMPQIIDNETFEQAQIMLEKNKKAPARTKSKEEQYLLTTKLFCGNCEFSMVGVSGTSKLGKIHQYYQCNGNRKKKCTTKSVKKHEIENLVVNSVMKILTSDKIDEIAKNICDLSEKESNSDTLKRLKKLVKENAVATANLIKALENGKAVDVISAQIEKRQTEKQNLEAQIAREKIQRPKLRFDQVRFFEKFIKGDINDVKFRQALIDTFINKIYLFADKLCIFCNAQDSKIQVPLNKLEGSYLGHLAGHRGLEPRTTGLKVKMATFYHILFKSVKH